MSAGRGEEEWSWVGADGHLRSGSRDEMMRSYADGHIPPRNPVKKSDWNDWISVGELVAPKTEPYNGLPFEETFSTRTRNPVILRTDSSSEDVTVPRGVPALSPQQAQMIVQIIPAPGSVPAPPRKSRAWILLLPIALLALVGAALAFVIVWKKVVLQKPEPVKSDALTPSAAPPAPPPPIEKTYAECRASGTPVRLLGIVPPGATFHTGTRDSRMLVGAPTSERQGVGLTIDPKTLSIVEQKALADPTRVGGVVPSGDGFSVDRFTTRVPGSNFSVGMTPNGFSRLGDDLSEKTIWGGDATLPITRPAIVPIKGRGFALAFRRGDADVRAGWIDEHGARASDLVQLTSEGQKTSAPSIAGSDERVIVAFSAVDAEGKSRVVLADLAPKLRTLPTIGENPRAPAIQLLGTERFLVTWLQGDVKTGRSLHARVVGADLTPVGPEQTLASFTRPVESIALWRNEGEVVALLAERAATSRNELFALRIECK
jgi:hypothetical protein